MLALLQRVNFAKVVVDGKVTGQIDKGILAFIGLEKGDNETKCKRMFDKIVKYRMFYDENEKLSLAPLNLTERILLNSQLRIELL